MPLDPEEFFPDPFADDPNDSKDTFKELVKRNQPQSKSESKGSVTGVQGEQSQQKPPLQKEKQQPQKEQQQPQATESQHQAQLQKQKQQRQKQKQKEQIQQQQQQQPKPREKTQEELEQEARQRAKDIQAYKSEIYYSSYYYVIVNKHWDHLIGGLDDIYAYRHVKLPKSISRWLPHYGLLKQKEWEYLGVEQEAQWEHYMVHAPEPHILLFRREFKGVEEQLKNEERQERLRRRKRETGAKEDKNRAAIADNAIRAAKRQKP